MVDIISLNIIDINDRLQIRRAVILSLEKNRRMPILPE
jgi:hypothetical protein